MKKMLLILSMFFCVAIADEFVESKTTLGGYGEMHYDMEKTNDAGEKVGKLDFHRFIFYIKHQFNSEWSMMSEIEVEHNMVGSQAALDGYEGGYVAMEQAHLNYWNGKWGFKGGVLLVPAGIINEYHEPPTFMSVERPEYNSKIIPTTWFGNGFAVYGTMNDFNWNVTMTGDLNGDDIKDGIRSARRKGQYETTEGGWLTTLQGSYTGFDGLKVGGSMTMNSPMRGATADAGAICAALDANGDVQTSDVNGVQTLTLGACNNEIAASAVDVTLTEVNATWNKDNLFARMEYGMIDYSNNFHHQDAQDTPTDVNGDPTLDTNGDSAIDEDDATWNLGGVREIKSSSGYYIDLGYNVADMVGCDGDLYLWTRTSSYNKDDDRDAHDISLFGVTYKPLDNISFKFEMGESGDKDVMRMGLGYMF